METSFLCKTECTFVKGEFRGWGRMILYIPGELLVLLVVLRVMKLWCVRVLFLLMISLTKPNLKAVISSSLVLVHEWWLKSDSESSWKTICAGCCRSGSVHTARIFFRPLNIYPSKSHSLSLWSSLTVSLLGVFICFQPDSWVLRKSQAAAACFLPYMLLQ